MAIERIIGSAAVLTALAVAAMFAAQGMLGDTLVRPGTGTHSPVAARATVPAAAPSTAARPSYGRTVTLRADSLGHFETNAVINGRSVEVLVDTGATTVAISSETARRLGVLPPSSAFAIPIATANGTLEAAPVMLSEVSVGGISLRNVQAVVIPGKALGVSLLGMTFLSRLRKFEVSRGELLLTE